MHVVVYFTYNNCADVGTHLKSYYLIKISGIETYKYIICTDCSCMSGEYIVSFQISQSDWQHIFVLRKLCWTTAATCLRDEASYLGK